MADDTKKVIPDPDAVPVRHITGLASINANGQTIFLNLVTDRMAVYSDGSCEPDLIIAARLHFDIEVARKIRDQLSAHLGDAPVHAETKLN